MMNDTPRAGPPGASDNPASREQSACPEFDCASCGRSMVVLVGGAPCEPLCHRCRMLPGWHKRPEVTAAIEVDEHLLAAAPAGAAEDGRALQ